MLTIEYKEKEVLQNIQKDGVYHIICSACEHFKLNVASKVQTTLLITFKSIDKLQCDVEIHEDANVKILYQYEGKYELFENVNLLRDAFYRVGYYSLDNFKSKAILKYHLLQQGSSVEVITSTKSMNANLFDLECIHEISNTSSKMENYAIVDDDANYEMIASGTIKKGAKGSKSHQSTKVLTMSDKQSSKVTPLLLIDENDVEASHATSIGQMNEDHLYYLQTRGISKEAAFGLLTLSYVLPILRVVEDDEELMKLIQKEIETKVGLSC